MNNVAYIFADDDPEFGDFDDDDALICPDCDGDQFRVYENPLIGVCCDCGCEVDLEESDDYEEEDLFLTEEQEKDILQSLDLED